MYSRDELFRRPFECYFGVYFPRCFATRGINTKITLSCAWWALKHYSLFIIGTHGSPLIHILMKVLKYIYVWAIFIEKHLQTALIYVLTADLLLWLNVTQFSNQRQIWHMISSVFLNRLYRGGAELGTYPVNSSNIMDIDATAPCVARTYLSNYLIDFGRWTEPCDHRGKTSVTCTILL